MTYSIIAKDSQTGAFGVATATGGPAVGSLVPHVSAGFGALATQGFTNPLYAHDGLKALESGQSAEAIVYALTTGDADRERRQFIVIDRTGRTGGWTGGALEGASNMVLQQGFAVAGNLLSNAEVIPAMAEAFARTRQRFADRLLAALGAADEAGGDARGVLSAAMKIHTDQPYPAIDIRIDYSRTPLADLAELFDRVRTGPYADFVAQLPRR